MTSTPAINPPDLVDLAVELSGRSESSAVRSACDRAYYGAFLFARDRLDALGKATPHRDARDHNYIPSALKKLPGGIGHGDYLMALLRQRRTYTYDTGPLTSDNVRPVSWIISKAQGIVRFVDQLT